ncbi:hypothetical protein [Antarctobacter jejuensis]|uniref:hypothetical protein n=1 Tax=Antarctobacter jejuensis TaxID=1439938 RepID=UPI003FD2262B
MRVSRDHCGNCYDLKPVWQNPGVFWSGVSVITVAFVASLALGVAVVSADQRAEAVEMQISSR